MDVRTNRNRSLAAGSLMWGVETAKAAVRAASAEETARAAADALREVLLALQDTT